MSKNALVPKSFLMLVLWSIICACSGGSGQVDSGADADADTDADGDSDSVTDTDTEDECAAIVCEQECVRFADVEAGAGGDGLSWDMAFQKVQLAIDSAAAWATCCETPCQVWIAKGTYYVYESNVHDTINLADRVQLYGGFSKLEGDPDERDIEANPTILDGRAGPDSEDRVYHVVSAVATHASEVFNDVILDGLNITQGAALGAITSSDAVGAGLIWGTPGHLIVRHCSFRNNESIQGSAGALIGFSPDITGYLSVVIEDSAFSENSALLDGDLSYGGAMNLISAQQSVIRRCLFESNSADVGAAIFVWANEDTGSDIMIENSVFLNNSSNYWGHALDVHTWSTSPDDSTIGIVNSVFYNNTSLNPYEQEANLRGVFEWNIQNSIDINSSIIIPLSSGNNLVDIDPLFVDAVNGDFRLQPGSPCIDAADGSVAPEFDFLGNPRVDDPATPNTGIGPPWADIGAFEYQPE